MSDAEDSWQQRALAAERTVDVLARKVLALYAGEGTAAIQKQLAKAQERQREARQRRALMEMRTEELAKYSASLETQVAQRTRELRTILDHVTSGFLLIDRRAVVLSGYTQSCHEILARADLVGVDVAEALGTCCERKRAHLTLAIEQVFDDILPEEVSLDMVGGRYRLGARVVQVDARVVRDEGVITHLLLTLNDATALDAAQCEARTNRTLLHLLREKTAFVAFLEETRSLLGACRKALANNDPSFVKRALHTIKGNAAAFDLRDVVALIHQLEEASAHGEEQLTAVEQALDAFLTLHHGVLGIELDAERCTERPLALEPARLLLGPLEIYVESLGQQLGKHAQCTLLGMDTLVDVPTMRPVFQSLTHLIRNAVDHGIEPDGCRGSKPPVGTVRIELHEDEASWHLSVDDDGRGIDVDLEMIFASGFSTKTEVSEISGRGLGMTATRDTVESRGGSMRAESTLGVGSRFVMTIPKPVELRASMHDAG